MDDARGAIEDLTRCLEKEGATGRAWFIRSQARAKLGDREGALQDRLEGLKRPPADEAGFVARGLARLPGDPQGAIVDFDAALALNPRYIPALQDKASVLSENLGRVEESIRVLDLALRYHPDNVPAMAGRGVLLARLGRREAAHRDARAALMLDDGALNLYQVGGIFALTSKQEPADVAEALRLLTESIRKDASWLGVIPIDRDLDPIRGRPEFRELVRAFTVVGRAREKPR
jgi:tetratricopeptide (TPR) repeat protein